eukprot:1599832-Pleurochrysis_carterae.AAC.2
MARSIWTACSGLQSERRANVASDQTPKRQLRQSSMTMVTHWTWDRRHACAAPTAQCAPTQRTGARCRRRGARGESRDLALWTVLKKRQKAFAGWMLFVKR